MIRTTFDDETRTAEIVLQAPQRLNSIDPDGLRDLADAYREAEARGARALLLRGDGRAFCAGRDISAVDPANDDARAFLDLVRDTMRVMSGIHVPTFAAVHGACLGVGLGLAIANDVVYVAERAKLGSPFAALGAALDSGGHWLFAERLGSHRALDLIYTGDLMSGAEAVAAGLFSRAVPDDELLAFARERVERVARGATLAFLASKRLISELRDEPASVWSSMDAETEAQLELQRTHDFREGFTSFQEKRPPVFRGE